MPIDFIEFYLECKQWIYQYFDFELKLSSNVISVKGDHKSHGILNDSHGKLTRSFEKILLNPHNF